MSRFPKRATMADVAQHAGVTKTTVSRVLNNKGEISPETREKVFKAVEHLGYRRSRIARSLATDQTFLLGLIVPSISYEFFTDIARGAENAAWENDYKILLCTTEGDWDREEGMFLFLEDIQADGIVVCSPRLPEDRLVPLVEQFENVVIVNGQGIAWHELAGAIETNDAGGIKLAVDHLIASGRRHLTYLGGPPDARVSTERYYGFMNALQAAGYTPNPAWHTACHPATVHEGYESVKRLQPVLSEIDGIVCFNDLVAAGAMRACHELGVRVPDDIAITGCDDIQFATLVQPSLTTLQTPKEEIGTLAVNMLLERIGGQRKHDNVIIDQHLIIRESAP
ncbi:MAG TPA: LacI family DNA-binding transcriptional regulator [Aggregatilinea sp.]|jgi:LacI family transcriptional regulator|uniref:LacI family DNA-binding transcriptional regulator n=1 Tax=Aggregatilinea sp. TaxID=2806333 RepID=UPI002CF8A142|nr:LacI family DNA-binding transcriptional regulator [Aggregatilinea sp.]HML22893.1 LacI family DNA-binding transcriptional regulator [Aggregatilinea sp.]